MRIRIISFLSLLLFLPQGVYTQTTSDTFGTSWIREGQTYLRLAVADDGMYRIASLSLKEAGVPVAEVPGRAYQLFRHGAEEPIWVSSEAEPLGPVDFIEFLGRRPNGALDTLLLPKGATGLNPEVSLFADSTLYFLTWSDKESDGSRFSSPVVEDGTFRDFVTALDIRLFRESFTQPNYHSYLQDSRMEAAEGYGSAHQYVHEWRQALPGYLPHHGPVELTIRYATRSDVPDRVIFGSGVQGPASVYPNNAWRVWTFSREFLPSSDRLALFAQAEGGRITLASAKGQYPRSVESLTAGDQPVWVAGDSIPRTVAPNSGYWVHPGQGWRIAGDTVHLPASRDPWLYQPASAIRWLQPTQIITPSLLPTNPANYVLIGPSQWLESGGAGEALAAYRSSVAGGAYRVQTWSLGDLAFWFGYGYERHPLAYRRWARWLRSQGAVAPMIVLLGKTLTYVNQRQTTESYPGPPTFGHPGSDHLLFEQDPEATSLSVGRIAARTEQDLWHYVQKVQRYEGLLRSDPEVTNHYWRKRVLHLSGGRGSERARFAVLLDQLERSLTQNSYGAEVIKASRESDRPIDVSVSEKAITAINQGIGIKTFMGHGAVVNTDIGLDDPGLFEPTDKTGLFFSLGCSTGNLFTVQESISERFVLARDRGALTYIATSGVASDYGQFAFTRQFYEALGGDCFACPLGTIMQQVRQQFGHDTSRIHQILTQQMTFHGDPAVHLQIDGDPDYALDSASVRVTTDQLVVALGIKNLGRNRNDTVPVQLLLVSPSGKKSIFHTAVVVQGQLELEWAIPFPDGRMSGEYQLFAALDPDRALRERTRKNNALPHPVSLEVIPPGPSALFPPEGWIVTDTVAELWASVPDAFAEEVIYQFEVDTVPDFSSPIRKRMRVVGGSAVRWRLAHLPVSPGSETPVFWRVYSPAEMPEHPPVHSFSFQPGRSGRWQQAHFWAFRQNQKDGLRIDATGWKLAERPVGILAMSVNGAPVRNDRSRLFIDNDSVDKVPHGEATFTVYTFDKQNPTEWTAKTYPVAEPGSRKDLVADLRTQPAGAPILLLGYVRKGYSFDVASWSKDSLGLRGYLNGQGATQLARLAVVGNAPYALAFRKDEEVLGEMLIPDTPATRSNLLFTLPFSVPKGRVISPRIGPARNWQSVSAIQADSASDHQQATLTLLAKASSGDTLHWGTWPVGNQPTRIDLSDLDAAQWPYLIMVYETEDPKNQLKSWTVDFDPATESALSDLSLPDTLWHGQPATLTGKTLVFPPDRTDIPVTISLQTEERAVLFSDSLTAPALFSWPVLPEQVPGDLPLSFQLTRQRPIFPEWIARNNRAQKRVFIRSDTTAPTLLLTLDGRVPAPDQRVGADLAFTMLMIDQNPFGLLGETALIDLRLLFPDGEEQLIPPDHPWIDLKRPEEPGDTLVLNMQCQLARPGRYILQITGRDRFGNLTNAKISFLVGEQQLALSLRPFPNPFSRQVQFGYTYRRLVPTTNVRLLIANSLGQVVRRVEADEFGPLLPGDQVADFMWDGKD